jgi:lipid-A-disaccharide synthase
MKNLLREWRPQVLVLVDYADFNLRLARVAHELGIRVLYYITPQLWAWRSGRAKLFERYVDKAAVIFPFERPLFEKLGYTRAVHVGHPFSDLLHREKDASKELELKSNFLATTRLDGTRKLLSVFPGSRKGEIRRLLGTALQASRSFLAKRPEIQIAIGVAPAVAPLVREMVGNAAPSIQLIEGRSLDLLRFSDAALLKSGTSNLQAAFFTTPFSMFFKASRLSEFIVTNFVGITQYSIVNVIRQNTVREFLQERASPELLAAEMERLLFDDAFREELSKALGEVAASLNSHDALPEFEGCRSEAERTAALVLSLL